MIAIGLTGGIGSGKSTVGSMLVGRGAVLIDADEIAREVVQPGRPANAKVIERFGDAVVAPDGSLDRKALAAVVFNDPVCLSDLEAIVHPEVRAEVLTRLAALGAGDDVVVIDLPLLVERGDVTKYALSGVLVVDAPVDIAIERLVKLRQMDRFDAEARIANQADRPSRIALADFVIMNMGTLEALEEMVGRAWRWIEQLRADKASFPDGAEGP
jgi:dephospho-CoA kinase